MQSEREKSFSILGGFFFLVLVIPALIQPATGFIQVDGRLAPELPIDPVSFLIGIVVGAVGVGIPIIIRMISRRRQNDEVRHDTVKNSIDNVK